MAFGCGTSRALQLIASHRCEDRHYFILHFSNSPRTHCRLTAEAR
jgi:hypothetical protein